MTDRSTLATQFLTSSGWGGGTLTLLAGDASNRKYFRLRDVPNKPDAVLMDAPEERGEDVQRFIKVADFLWSQNLSAPEIYAKDIPHGFLLLEDLGDDLFSTICLDGSSKETALYQAAADALIALHKAPPPTLDPYAPGLMAELAAQSVDWYALGREGGVDPAKRSAVLSRMEDALSAFSKDFTVTILRDYHAQNLIWLRDREGPARVGLLDFQDAMIGHPTYDLVSLLEDARRDVSPQTQEATLTYFIDQTGRDPVETRAAYATMGAQRNLRILMVFARLSLHFRKPDYVGLIPRVWAHLQGNLAQPGLEGLRDAVTDALPEPTSSHLTKLKEKCGTHPTRS
ncbi:aminoglycoside phosphotransferase family protein [Cognatishimia sp. MH4019]|uniref:aminoglycoside phosphotransferase family protein n=1 Tax=Cognatishimia sp. MH4019 TaxID=2854030 RepID=UPI001CD3EF24|nr:phosphotransferase [Cognatishimia sp. MH4019]